MQEEDRPNYTCDFCRYPADDQELYLIQYGKLHFCYLRCFMGYLQDKGRLRFTNGIKPFRKFDLKKDLKPKVVCRGCQKIDHPFYFDVRYTFNEFHFQEVGREVDPEQFFCTLYCFEKYTNEVNEDGIVALMQLHRINFRIKRDKKCTLWISTDDCKEN